MLNIDFGFYIVNKKKYELLSAKSDEELISLWTSKMEEVNFDNEILKNIIFDIDEEMFELKKEVFLHEINRKQLNDQLKYIYLMICCSVQPLSNYFFLKPAFHLSQFNFNSLPEKSLIKEFYYGTYVPKKEINVDYSSYWYMLEDTESIDFIKNLELLDIKKNEGENSQNIFFLLDKIKDFSNEEFLIIISKSI